MPPMKKPERHCPACGTKESKTPAARARKAVAEAQAARQSAQAERSRMNAQSEMMASQQGMQRVIGEAQQGQPMGRPQPPVDPYAALARAIIAARMRGGR